MKILHTSDWHLGKRLYNRDRLSEQQLILDEIHEIAEQQQVDAIVVAGDLFDVANPSNEASELFYKVLKKLSKDGKRPVIAIAGNHDSPQRIEAPDPLARECGIVFLGYPTSKVTEFKLDSGFEILHAEAGFLELKLPGQAAPLRIIATPYASEIRMKQYLGFEEDQGLRNALQKQWQTLAEKYCDNRGVNVAMAHLFVWNRETEPPEEPEGEKPVKVGNASVVYADLFPEQMQYVALGHLHRSQAINGGKSPVFYCGSPLGYSFSEANQKKYVHVVDLEPGKDAGVEKVELNNGREIKRKTFEQVDEAIKWLVENQDAFTEITMRTDDFLKADENKSLRDASENLVNIIPEPKNRAASAQNQKQIDMNQSVSDLFKKYFYHTHGQEPNNEMMEIFNEVLNQKSDQ
ncbi:MAG TPA: exonuclease subunit SbcD [Salinivirga sp.]|uniref:metallophosphoesterase family protein n=1 Tax=Salinivirga sp. TaxID=1970192 RepID=UPI002B464AB8|nr:exonuclease subunit SbcD [Salinivirga sp.]HKK59028.1 exonuclease subunit SbcD [Salinivirga sp.]